MDLGDLHRLIRLDGLESGKSGGRSIDGIDLVPHIILSEADQVGVFVEVFLGEVACDYQDQLLVEFGNARYEFNARTTSLQEAVTGSNVRSAHCEGDGAGKDSPE